MNLIVGGVAAFAGFPQITLVGIIGHLFAPLAWIIGVPWHDAALAGNFIGEKLIFNEFVAYGDLSPYLKGGAHVAAAGLQVLDPKTLAIVSFALCGFANFSSIAILAGGFSAVAPERRSEVARHGLRALTAATLSNLMSAAIAGLFFSLHWPQRPSTDRGEATMFYRRNSFAGSATGSRSIATGSPRSCAA